MTLRTFKNKGKKVYNRQVTTGGSWEGRRKVTAVVDSGMGATIGTRSRYRWKFMGMEDPVFMKDGRLLFQWHACFQPFLML
ncbi:hypothetical protein Tco_0395117, partial [Tanacetum coccineum]